MKAANKRMENDARISYPEREQARTKFNYELKNVSLRLTPRNSCAPVGAQAQAESSRSEEK